MPVCEYLLTVNIQQQKGSSRWGGRIGHLPVKKKVTGAIPGFSSPYVKILNPEFPPMRPLACVRISERKVRNALSAQLE